MEQTARSTPSTPTKRARALRSNLTDAERRLWFALRDRRFANYKFRRQVPMGRFEGLLTSILTTLHQRRTGGQPEPPR